MQCILCRAGGDTLHATGAFNGTDGDEAIDGKMRRAGLVAFAAVDAGFCVAANLDGADGGDDSHERAVGAEEAAPEVLNKDGEENEGCEDKESDGADMAEEVEHLHVGDDAERGEEKAVERCGRHAGDEEDEGGQQEVFEAAQRDVEPAWHDAIAAEEFAAELPEVFRERADGAEPGTEALLQQEAGEQEDGNQHERGGVHGGDVAGGEEVLQVHEAGDGKPAIDACGTGDVVGLAMGLKEARPQQKLDADPEIECEEGKLDDPAGELGVIRRGTTDKRLALRSGRRDGKSRVGSLRIHTLPTIAGGRGRE